MEFLYNVLLSCGSCGVTSTRIRCSMLRRTAKNCGAQAITFYFYIFYGTPLHSESAGKVLRFNDAQDKCNASPSI